MKISRTVTLWCYPCHYIQFLMICFPADDVLLYEVLLGAACIIQGIVDSDLLRNTSLKQERFWDPLCFLSVALFMCGVSCTKTLPVLPQLVRSTCRI